MNNYYNILVEENKNIERKIFDFFSTKPNQKDIDVFLKHNNIDEDMFNRIVYSILGSFIGEGRSKNKGNFNSKQMQMGLRVEMEHTSNKMIAEKITKDHLSEIPDYYSRLKKMEKEAE